MPVILAVILYNPESVCESESRAIVPINACKWSGISNKDSDSIVPARDKFALSRNRILGAAFATELIDPRRDNKW